MESMNSFHIENPYIKERMIVRNSLAFAFPSYMPIVPGHLLICPIRIVQSSGDLTKEEWSAIMELKSLLCNALKRAFDTDGFNFAWNEGEDAGQSIPHFHLHLVPRKNGDTGILEYEPRKFLYRPGVRKISPEQELQEIAELVRGFI